MVWPSGGADRAAVLAAVEVEPADLPAVEIPEGRLDCLAPASEDGRRGRGLDHSADGWSAGVRISVALWPPKPNEFDSTGAGAMTARLAEHDIEVDLVADPLHVRGGRDDPVAQRQQRDHRFHSPGRADHVAGDALRGRDRGSVVTEHLVQGFGLRRVVERRRRTVRVHVPDRCGIDARVVERELHAHGGARATGRRGGDVVRVAVPSVAGDDAVDVRAARDRTLERLEDDKPRAFGHHEAVAVGVERTRRARGIVVPRAERAHARRTPRS